MLDNFLRRMHHAEATASLKFGADYYGRYAPGAVAASSAVRGAEDEEEAEDLSAATSWRGGKRRRNPPPVLKTPRSVDEDAHLPPKKRWRFRNPQPT